MGTTCTVNASRRRKLERSASHHQTATVRSTRGVSFLIRSQTTADGSRYKLILNRIRSQANDPQQQRIEQILIWLSFSYRSLKASEICSAIVFHTDDVLNAESKLDTRVLDLCKPLIEERENNTIALIHHSARE